MIKRFFKPFFWTVTLAVFLFAGSQILPITVDRSPTALVINEFMAANSAGLIDENGEYVDWLELYNPGYSPVNLSAWSLTDDIADPQKWPLPDRALGAGEYMVVFASGKNRATSEAGPALHTNFRLNQEGEFLGLYNLLDDKWGDVISATYPLQFRDIAYGRIDQPARLAYLSRPTPGQPNDETQSWAGVVERVNFSPKRGFYDSPIAVELSATTPGATIYYTTDGSEPGATNGNQYTGPIEVSHTTLLRAIALKRGLLPSSVDTHTYLFLDDILAQSNTPPPGFPPFDYEMDPEIVHHPVYRDSIKDGLKAIPTLSIVTAAENYDIYANPREQGVAWERPVSVELIYPDESVQADLQLNTGLRIQGGWGRWEVMPKHSFRLFFKGIYGPPKLDHPLFPDSPIEQFDTLILRGGVNRSYAGKTAGLTVDHRLTTYTRDEWLRASQIALSGTGSHGIFIHLYLNGMYWGLYNLVERPDASFTSAYLGGEKEEWYAMNHRGQISGPDTKIDTLLRQFAQLADIEPSQRYAAAAAYVDIPQFIDYVILNFYAGNIDWSDSNWYAGMHGFSGKIQFFSWDSELTWLDGAKLYFVEDEEEMGQQERLNVITPAFKALMENDDFKMAFADRLYQHLFNDGVLTDANSQARWREVNQNIDRAIVAESARWGDTRYEPPITQADWFKARDDVQAQMAGNADKLAALTRARGYYPPLDPPLFSQPGGLVTPGFHLTLTNQPTTYPTNQPPALRSQPTIYYTTDGSDPRLPGTGEVSPGAVVYRSPLVITTTTQVKARTLAADSSASSGQIWSALNQAVFTLTPQDSQLRLTEIMYHPPEGDNYEFIELKNTGEAAVELANLAFVAGINFIFAPNTPPLQPGDFMVLVNNAAAFAQRYPAVPIGGVYGGRLSNKGEELRLQEPAGTTVLTVTYADENGWPVSPDGRGDSLVLIDPDGDPNNPTNWQASSDVYGSPGADEPTLTKSE